MILRKRTWLICLCLTIAFSGHVDAQSTSPAALVEKLHSALLAAMQAGPQTGCAGRYELLLPVVRKAFDFNLIARLAVGRFWRGLDNQQRTALENALLHMSTATYAENFDSFAGERFATLSIDRPRKDKAVVKTLLTTAKGEKVDLDYICHQGSGGWRIVSVSAKGVNDLSMKRAEYTSFLKTHSIAAMIEKLEEKAQNCTRKPS